MKAFLGYLLTASKVQVKSLLRNLTTDQLKLLVEIIYNVAKGIIPLSDSDKSTLWKYKRIIHRVLLQGLTRRQRQQRLVKIRDLLPIFIRGYLQWQES